MAMQLQLHEQSLPNKMTSLAPMIPAVAAHLEPSSYQPEPHHLQKVQTNAVHPHLKWAVQGAQMDHFQHYEKLKQRQMNKNKKKSSK